MTTKPTLLAALYAMSQIPQAEVAVTKSIAWLCSTEKGSNPLATLIAQSGLEPGDDAVWHAEVIAKDRTRTDLECSWGTSGVPRVVVEAKLDHTLTVEQVRTYISDLSARQTNSDNPCLMVLLVPAYRTSEARSVLDAAMETADQRVRNAVWTFDEVMDALSSSLGESSDLEQLRGLIEACEALDIKPLTRDEINDWSPAREADLERVLDLATAAVTRGRLLNSQKNRERDFTWMRYIETRPGGTNIGVGLRRPHELLDRTHGWAWVRIHERTTNARQAGDAVVSQWPERASTLPNGATWMPLTLLTDVGGAAVQQDLSDQLSEIINVVTQIPD